MLRNYEGGPKREMRDGFRMTGKAKLSIFSLMRLGLCRDCHCRPSSTKTKKVKSPSLHYQVLIALHSPDGVVETGLLWCPPEKTRSKAHLQHSAVHFLRSDFRARIGKVRPFLAISREIQEDFSALQTVWRREVDSNPRYGFATLSLDTSVSCR